MMSLPTLIVLAGGQGTRLRSVVYDKPKILAPIAGKPYISHLLCWCEENGLKRVHLSLGYKYEQVVQWIKNNDVALDISFSVEKKPLGTGGAIKDALTFLSPIESSQVLVCNGDTFVDFDLQQFIQQCEPYQGGMLTVNVDNCSRFGAVVHESGLLIAFEEKKLLKSQGEINAGWYFLGEKHINLLKKLSISSFENEYLTASSRPKIKCVPIGSNFLDFGTPESYSTAQKIFQE